MWFNFWREVLNWMNIRFSNLALSTNATNLNYYQFMENFFDSTNSISPLVAILWCFYPIGILVLAEILLGGGIDDDNDDHDGGMLIPAYASSQN